MNLATEIAAFDGMNEFKNELAKSILSFSPRSIEPSFVRFVERDANEI